MRAKSATRLKTAWESIIDRFSHDFEDDDEIDLNNLQVIKSGGFCGSVAPLNFGALTSYLNPNDDEETDSEDGNSDDNVSKLELFGEEEDIFVKCLNQIGKTKFDFVPPPINPLSRQPNVSHDVNSKEIDMDELGALFLDDHIKDLVTNSDPRNGRRPTLHKKVNCERKDAISVKKGNQENPARKRQPLQNISLNEGFQSASKAVVQADFSLDRPSKSLFSREQHSVFLPENRSNNQVLPDRASSSNHQRRFKRKLNFSERTDICESTSSFLASRSRSNLVGARSTKSLIQPLGQPYRKMTPVVVIDLCNDEIASFGKVNASKLQASTTPKFPLIPQILSTRSAVSETNVHSHACKRSSHHTDSLQGQPSNLNEEVDELSCLLWSSA
jgi:hypothetical protein